jgi:UDP-N-acetylmuramyl pentapeptide phosphotransferase/UDP-N-acetylglucosamine-1-phosphate transferase
MQIFGGIIALIVGVAGWYYLFYSTAATRLGGIEDPAMNQRRQRLRRTNGAVMLLLGALIYAGSHVEAPHAFVLIWLSVLVLFFVFVALGMADIRLTAKLRRKR